MQDEQLKIYAVSDDTIKLTGWINAEFGAFDGNFRITIITTAAKTKKYDYPVVHYGWNDLAGWFASLIYGHDEVVIAYENNEKPTGDLFQMTPTVTILDQCDGVMIESLTIGGKVNDVQFFTHPDAKMDEFQTDMFESIKFFCAATNTEVAEDFIKGFVLCHVKY